MKKIELAQKIVETTNELMCLIVLYNNDEAYEIVAETVKNYKLMKVSEQRKKPYRSTAGKAQE